MLLSVKLTSVLIGLVTSLAILAIGVSIKRTPKVVGVLCAIGVGWIVTVFLLRTPLRDSSDLAGSSSDQTHTATDTVDLATSTQPLLNPEEVFPGKNVIEITRVLFVEEDLHVFLRPSIFEDASASGDCYMWGDIVAQVVIDAAGAVAKIRGAELQDCIEAILCRCEESLSDPEMHRTHEVFKAP